MQEIGIKDGDCFILMVMKKLIKKEKMKEEDKNNKK